MTDTAIFGIALTIINGLILLILANIRSDQKETKASLEAMQKEEKKAREESTKDMWHRIYSHYHEISCRNDECREMKTGNVIVPVERV